MAKPLSTFSILRRHGRLLVQCLLVVTIVRLGLTFSTYSKLARRMPPVAQRQRTRAEVNRMTWAVRRVARLVPYASCLTQALSAQYLCARYGHATQIRIGVERSEDGKIAAHAWLIEGDDVLIGGTDQSLARYTHLTDLDHARP